MENVTIVSLLQGIGDDFKHSEMLVSNLELLPNLELLSIGDEKPGNLFNSNTNCQIINFVINGLDSSNRVAEILKSLETVPFKLHGSQAFSLQNFSYKVLGEFLMLT